MTKHLLIDLENVQPSASAVAAWIGSMGKAWIFYGPHQHKLLKSFHALGDRVTLVPISRPGANSLDFHLVFYLGYLAAGNPKSEFSLLSKDTGYDPAIAHARMLTFTIKRISALSSPMVKPALSVVDGAAKAPRQVRTAKKVATAKPAPQGAASSQKALEPKGALGAKKVLAKSASAKQAKPRTKKSTAATEVESTVRRIPEAVPAVKATPARKRALQTVISLYRDVLADLQRSNQPRTLASLERHIQSRIGGEPAPERVQTIVDRLKTSDAIRIVGRRLEYLPADAATTGPKKPGTDT